MQVTDFVKACVSFNEVTIPSVKSILRRLNLFLETAEVALQNALVSHTEGLLKKAISSLQEIQSKDELRNIGDEEGIVAFVQKLAAFLVVVPGHPTLGAFYLLKGLLMLLDSQPWLMPGLRSIQALCAIVSSTAALAQKELPYHVENKEATDEVIEHCINLVKIAKSSSHTDDRYLQVTTKLLAKSSQNSMCI